MVRWLVGVLALFVSFAASAVTPGSLAWTLMSATENFSLVPQANGVVVSDGVRGGSLISRSLSQGAAGAVTATENYAASVAGGDIVLTAARGLTLGAIAEGAALGYAAGYVGFNTIGAPLAVAIGNTQFDIGDTRCTATLSGWQCDAGTPPVSQAGICFQTDIGLSFLPSIQPGACFLSPAAAVTADLGALGEHISGVGCSQSGNTFVCNYTTDKYGYSHAGPAIGGYGRPGQVPNACPAVVDALNPAWSRPAGGSPNKDGKCPSGRYNNADKATVTDRLTQYMDQTKTADLVQDILQRGGSVATPSPAVLSGPASATGQPSTEVKTNPDGSTSTTTKTPVTNYTYNTAPNTITVSNATTTVTNTCTAAGSCSTTTTGVTGPDAKPAELKVCGLPGGAACKIDETGTNTVAPDWRTGMDGAFKPPNTVAADPGSFFPKLPVLNWSFELPTFCGPIALPAFAPYLESVDICPFQPMFHDLMSVVWLVGGLFGAVQMFLRDALAS